MHGEMADKPINSLEISEFIFNVNKDPKVSKHTYYLVRLTVGKMQTFKILKTFKKHSLLLFNVSLNVNIVYLQESVEISRFMIIYP